MTTFTTRYRTTTVRGPRDLLPDRRRPGESDRRAAPRLPGQLVHVPRADRRAVRLVPPDRPDHLGFGRSATPSVRGVRVHVRRPDRHHSELLDQLGLDRFALYMQDYGAPIGFRIASQQPARITALISQNGNAYLDGITPFWEPLLAFAEDGVTNAEPVRASLEPAGPHWAYTHGVPADRLDRVSPDNWTIDQAGLDRPGNKEIQLTLFRDYRFNLELYPKFQEYFRTHQPPTLAVWGAHDEIFGPDGARAFARDLPDAEIHLLDAGHFALESSGEEITNLVRSFLRRVL